MNFLCHALPYFDQPIVAVSTGVPDFLSVIDRKIRARARLARPFLEAEDETLRQVAAGILAHIDDDRWFHSGETFVRLNLEFAVQLRDLLPGDAGFRPTFVGHIVIEMLLDSNYLADHRKLVDDYYDMARSLPVEAFAKCVNQITGKPTDKIPAAITRFNQTQFLYDYASDQGLLHRLNQVMARVGLAGLPESLVDWLADARQIVRIHHQRLLTQPGNPMAYPSLDA